LDNERRKAETRAEAAEAILRHVRRIIGVNDDADIIDAMDRLQRKLFAITQKLEGADASGRGRGE